MTEANSELSSVNRKDRTVEDERQTRAENEKPNRIPYDPRKLMTTPEVAARLNLKLSTVYHMVNRGVLPGFKVGGSMRFEREEIEILIKNKFSPEEKK